MLRAASFAAVLCSGLLLGACGDDEAPTAGPPRDFFGVVSEDVFAGESAYRGEMLGKQRDAGIGTIRQTFDWSAIETAPGRFDFGLYDTYMTDLAKAEMEVLPILFQPPPFHSSRPATGAEHGTYPPRNPADMAAFAARLVERYGPDGRFWKENPELPERPIHAWQVWNEPSFPAYWPTGPDAAEYAELLTVTGRAIKEADPDAQVVTAGLPQTESAIPIRDFVIGMHDARAEYDVLAIHPYGVDARTSLALLADTRELLDDIGSDAPLWATEFGWATQGPRSPYTLGPSRQAQEIGEFLEAALEQREALGLRGLVYYKWTDTGPFPGGSDHFGLHSGLLRIDGKPKPSLAAFRRVASGAP